MPERGRCSHCAANALCPDSPKATGWPGGEGCRTPRRRTSECRRNKQGAYSVSNITATRNDDDSVTVRFGGSGDNSIPVPEGWNYLVRLYRPRPEILSGAWSFPTLAQ